MPQSLWWSDSSPGRLVGSCCDNKMDCDTAAAAAHPAGNHCTTQVDCISAACFTSFKPAWALVCESPTVSSILSMSSCCS